MGRVTATEVKQIIDSSISDTDLAVFINAANLTITEVLGSDTTLSDAQLKEIERWLTAHLMACTREPQLSKFVIKDAEGSYQGITGKGLEATLYGQQVMILDTTGKFRMNAKRKPASLKAIVSSY